jgi:hypothetical protein
MSNFLRATAVAISLGAAGCAIHPLPDDVTGISSHQIVKRIRCEARDAVRDILVENLRKSTDPVYGEMNRRLAEDIESGALPLHKISDRTFRGRARYLVGQFEDTAVAYNFTFDMTELNNIDPTINLIRPFNNGVGTAAIGANFDRTRENIRTFTISDTFLGLFQKLPPNYCDEPPPGRNYIYPITGNIGLREMINTFVQLALVDNLSGASGPPTLGDTFLFTTTIAGSVTPKVVLTPIGTSLQLADASFLASARRDDVHKMVVGLAYKPRNLRVAFSSLRTPSLGFLVDAKGNAAQIAAAHTVEQMLIRFELGRRSSTILVPGQ